MTPQLARVALNLLDRVSTTGRAEATALLAVCQALEADMKAEAEGPEDNKSPDQPNGSPPPED
jgi:hypothetical protein